MGRGQKHGPETIYAVMASYAVTGNYAETAKTLKLAPNTVKGIYLKNKDKKEFAQLLDKNKELFAEQATEFVNKSMKILLRRTDRALDHEEKLDKILSEFEADSELKDSTKKKLVAEITKMQMQSVSDVARAMAIAYDKRALAKGEATENTEITISLEEN